jgi:hypothetical protein
MDTTLHMVLAFGAAIAAAAWLASVAWTSATLGRARSGDDAEAVVARAGRLAGSAAIGAFVAALVAGGAGLWYVLDRDLSLASNWWVGTAIGAWVVAFFGSTITRRRELSTAVRLSGERGTEDEDVQWRIRRVDLLGRGETLLLAVAIAVVAWQPGLDAFGDPFA